VFGYKFVKDFVSSNASGSLSSFLKSPAETGLFTGKLSRLDVDLHLFTISEFEKMNEMTPSHVYFTTGVYVKGPYKGYERIVAVREPLGPGDAIVYIFATKDRNTFIFHDTDHATTIFPETDWRNPYLYIDKKKISKTDILPSEQPDSISLNGSFSLFRDGIVTTNVKSGRTSKEGYDIYENIIQTDFSSYERLEVKGWPLTFYGVINPRVEIPAEWEEDARVQQELRSKYTKGTTRVIAVDSTGLPYAYSLTRPNEIRSYKDKLKSYENEARVYEKERIRFEKKEIKELPEYPTVPNLPNLRFNGADVKSGGDRFAIYDIAVPYLCGVDVDLPTIQNISDDELQLFGTVFGQQVFTLKNTEHPFYKFAYRNKMLMSKEEFESINKGMKKLTFEEYVTKHPVLFFKDFWGRWVAAGEYEYKMIGGCGKPVLYLYPPKATRVSIMFAKSMDVTYSIPSYRGSWLVNAYPDGTLTDLVPDRTDCTKFDGSHIGAEYANNACLANQYPYIYWAGNRVGMDYPFNPHVGWIVSNDLIPVFLQSTLDRVGFTTRERNDFLSYWVPTLLSKQASWYHIRFLQTRDMNMFIPMHIDPTPDRYYRLFLDWKPLSAPPTYMVSPQQLDPVIRKGFTVVEWGGLKQ
jgi:hypothetical protein